MNGGWIVRVFATLAALAIAEARAGDEPPCAHSAAELHTLAFPSAPVPIGAAKPADYAFAASAACLQRADDGTPLPAMVIRIERSADPVNLRLTSISGKDATLPARIELLGEDFAALKSYPFERFVKRGLDYTLTLFLNASTQTHYLLVTPDTEWLGRSNNLTSGNRWTAFWSTGTVMGTISNGTEQHRQLPFASGGTLRIEAEGDARTVGAHPR